MYGQIDEESEYGQEEVLDDFLYGGLDSNGSDEDGLFRRVDKVKKSIQNENGGFLDSLLESQPLVNKANDDTDNESVGEKSFLSDFLHDRAAQNGTTKQRKGVGAASKGLMVSTDEKNNNNDFKDKCQNYVSNNNALSLVKHYAFTAFRRVQQWNKNGYILPTSRIEFVKYGLLALIFAPLFHVAITMALGGKSHRHGKSVHTYLTQNKVNPSQTAKEVGSLYVMLSSSSSVKENVILIPDTDWIEMPPKPPKRIALPPRLGPRDRPESAMVLFSLSASSESNPSTNINGNTKLWESIRSELRPKPIDAWPSWYHNSSSHIREDGFTVMYSIRKRDEAKSSLTQLAEEFGQSSFYEFLAWDETNPDVDIELDNADIPRLPRKQTDIMIRKTIPTSASGRGKSQDASASDVLVLRRVRDLPIEDDLTLRDFEGPPMDEIIWNKASA
jgi:hypothetical protein